MGFLRRIVACCFGLLVLVVRGYIPPPPDCISNDLWQEIRDGCPRTELNQMCSSVLSYPTSRSTDTITSTITFTSWTYLTPHRTKTVKATTHLDIVISKTFTKTITSTQADKTVTRSACKPTITCGAVTITNSFGPLRDACECIYEAPTTTTLHTTFTGYFPVVYATTKTFTRAHYATTTTIHPIVTTKVPTLTAYQCKTFPPPANSCSNEQMQIAHYDYVPENNKPGSINLEKYKTMKPKYTYTDGTIYEAGVYYYPEYPYERSCYNRYDNGRGYIYAPQTGFYNWSLAAVNKAAWLWIDSYAYSGWNKSNSFLSAANVPHGGGPWRLIHWEAGTYHAFRFAWFCAHNPFDLYYHLRRPDGLILFGQYSPGTGYGGGVGKPHLDGAPYGYYDAIYDESFDPEHNIESDYTVQFGCGDDAKLAPRFPRWGHET